MDLKENLESLSLKTAKKAIVEIMEIKGRFECVLHLSGRRWVRKCHRPSSEPTPQPYNKVSEVLNLELGDVKLNGCYSIERERRFEELLHFFECLVPDKIRGLPAVATMVMIDRLEPPALSRVIYSVLTKIVDAEHISSTVPTIIAPFLVPASKLKLEGRLMTTNSGKFPLYGIQVGPKTDVSRAIASKTQKPPPSLQIHYEPLACFLHLTLCEIGEVAASAMGLYFQREETKTNWIPTAKAASGGGGEPWRNSMVKCFRFLQEAETECMKGVHHVGR
ncbi:Got1/Sft2-like vescicle transport protein family isoform 1 [Hibiscus syriacus]|uniref:Got1/Sft2-like vescicle transport protein family isoform 1 n=1 Tax=Hibiscus syriacus TaxID=106335 RepID=A0A6A3CB81_HIBSY|nr:Got1/Sft2-like vescicle transport protein family isoform 1 [Hibiscus syriacus]